MVSNDSADILQNIDPRTQASFSLSNRLLRAVWNVVYSLFFRLSPRVCHAWRSFLLTLFGAKVGSHCHIYPTARVWAPWNLELGDYVGIGDDVICYSIAPIHIGSNVTVSQGSYLCTGSHDYEDPRFQLIAHPITIEDQVWVCAQAFIGPGVTLHEGSVIGARSVVIKDIPAWMVCAGNPCRPIKARILRDATE